MPVGYGLKTENPTANNSNYTRPHFSTLPPKLLPTLNPSRSRAFAKNAPKGIQLCRRHTFLQNNPKNYYICFQMKST